MKYYDNMSTLLQCASAIVARPGTATTSEAILSTCPLIFNTLGGIMPQENITVKYCQKHGFGKVINRTKQLPVISKNWMSHPRTIEEEKETMRTLQPKQHPLDILKKLYNLIA